MAGSFGYQFIFFSVIFYLFLGMILLLPGTPSATQFLTNVTFNGYNYTGSYDINNVTTITPTTWDYVGYIFQNPFSSLGWLAWLSIGILITDIYIIVTSVIP